MPTVDDKGRIVLPKEVRERLGVTPGTEVEVRAEDGRAVVEPEDDPEAIIERMEQLIDSASRNPDQVAPEEDLHPIAREHAQRIRDGVKGGEYQHE